MFICLNAICIFSFLISLCFLFTKKAFKYNIAFSLCTALFSLTLYSIEEKYDLFHSCLIFLLSPFLAFLLIFNIFASYAIIKSLLKKKDNTVMPSL